MHRPAGRASLLLDAGMLVGGEGWAEDPLFLHVFGPLRCSVHDARLLYDPHLQEVVDGVLRLLHTAPFISPA